MTDDIEEQPATKDIRFHARLMRLSDCIAGDPNIDEDLWDVPLAALAEIERLRALVKDLQNALGPYPLAAHVIEAWKKAERRDGIVAKVVIAPAVNTRARYDVKQRCLWATPGCSALRGRDLSMAEFVWMPEWWRGSSPQTVLDFLGYVAVALVRADADSPAMNQLRAQSMLAAQGLLGKGRWGDD